MRLLNVKSMELAEFFGDQIPQYAILSHCWGNGEVTFKDIHNPSWMEKAGAEKIKFTITQARKDDIKYVWIDTCCIDKTSSAELSEAINSMFAWYESAVICYAYLEDVEPGELTEPLSTWEDRIRRSKWFTRGWTLQELIAPNVVQFYSKGWITIGSKADHLEPLSRVTRIPVDVLEYPSNRHSASVAKKMSWAANRQTTRIEDSAYSLLGIFGVNMPLLYGEGRKAFIRLQEEILRETDDHSLLTWASETEANDNGSSFVGVLADSADAFSAFANVVPFLSRDDSSPCLMTARGLRIDVQLMPWTEGPHPDRRTALIDCYTEDLLSYVLSLDLEHIASNSYARVPGMSAIRKFQPQLGKKETIYILKNAPNKFLGTIYRISCLRAEKSGFRITQVLPTRSSWDPRASLLQLSSWQKEHPTKTFLQNPAEQRLTSWVSITFSNERNGFGFVVSHYIKHHRGKRNHCLRISTNETVEDLNKWIVSNHTATDLSSGPDRLSFDLPSLSASSSSYVVDVSIKSKWDRTNFTGRAWELTVEIREIGKKETTGLLQGWLSKT